MINIDALTPDISHWFFGFFFGACVVAAIALICTWFAFREGEGRVKAVLCLVGFAVLAGTLALPTYLYEVPKNAEAQAASDEAVSAARTQITEAVVDRYDVETVAPKTTTVDDCNLLTCESVSTTLSWTEVAEEVAGTVPSTDPIVSVVLNDGQVVNYGLMYNNDTGVATLLKVSDTAPIPGDLMKGD